MASKLHERTANNTTAPSSSSELSKKSKQLIKSESVDSQDDGANIQTLGEDRGLGKILLGLRYQESNSSLEVRVVRGDRLRCFGGGKAPSATYCSVIFLPDCVESVATTTVESAVGCPRWRGAFRFEKFPKASRQRCLQIQVHDPAAGGAVISEATLLLSNWSQEEFDRGIRVWKYLNGAQDTHRLSNKEGTAFLTLSCKPDKFKLALNRIEDLNPRYTAASETPEFQVKLQAFLHQRGAKLIKEATMRGLRSASGVEVNFFGAEFSVRFSKHGGCGHGVVTLRLVLSKQLAGESQQQEICWLELGSDVKRMDCRGLYQSVVENPNQAHVVSVRMSRPPVPTVPEDSTQKYQKPSMTSGSHHKHEV